MSSNNYKDKESKGTSKSLPQYGKKGHKPRTPYTRKEVSLDEIRTNDIQYWNKTSGFTDVTKFNWDLIIGRKRSAGHLTPILPEKIGGELNPAQIMLIHYIAGPGYASNVDSGVNRALAQLMARIRSSLSTSNIGFETADLGIFFSSTSSIAMLIGYAKRILESYTVWKDRNYVYPRALITAQGCLYEDIAANINSYSARLNAAIDMYNNMSLLDCFDIYDRQYSMAHNIFADEDSQFGQLYMFIPDNYYVYVDTATPSKAVSVDFNPMDFISVLLAIDESIAAWYNSSDLYQINGTLLRAFKDAPRQHIPHYERTDIINPVVDRAFLMQIMNCTIHNVDVGSLDIIQDASTQNYVIWNPVVTSQEETFYVDNVTDVMLRVFEENVDPDDCMEMTRLLNFATEIAPNVYHLKDCGSEVVTAIDILTYDAQLNTISKNTLTENYVIAGNPFTTDFRSFLAMQAFRYLPTVHVLGRFGTSDEYAYLGVVGDLYNWMIYNATDWHILQFVAYQSLWMPKNL